MSRLSSVLVGIVLLASGRLSPGRSSSTSSPVGNPGNAADPQTAQGAATGSPDFIFTDHLLTDVGAYAQSASAYGTFDQGGNVWEYDERARVSVTRVFRGISGGNFASFAENLSAGGVLIGQNANSEIGGIGFRVAAAVPEPATAGAAGALAVLLPGRRRRVRRPASRAQADV